MKKKMNSNTLLLLITIALFVIMYAIGCVIYASKGFTHLQTFLNILINNAGLLCVACGMTCVMLTGGVGNVIGSLFGVLINGTISTLVKTNGKLLSSWSSIAVAALLCFFIVLQSVFAKIKDSKK